ncbi:MAG: protein kinase [Nitrosomonas sp.]|nr:protein kinase [Nitrosomonas sp.]
MTALHDQTLPEGTRIGVYEIKSIVNIGLFDITYRAWNHHFKDWVVLQEYFPSELSIRVGDGLCVEPKSQDNQETFAYGLKVFQDHADTLTKIEHPNIIAAENVLLLNGTAYLVMNSLDGVAFSEFDWSSASFTAGRFREILISMLQALQTVHDHNMVHGGIQPASVLWTKHQMAVLTGFSAARLAIASQAYKVADILATGYAPAEQFEAIDKIGPPTDFYALAATLYYCITQHKPISAQERLIAISRGEPDPLEPLSITSENASDATFAQVINTMLSPVYSDRPQSVTEIMAVLGSEQTDNKGFLNVLAVSGQSTDGPMPQNTLFGNIAWVGAIFGVFVLTIVELTSLHTDHTTPMFLADVESSPTQHHVDQLMENLVDNGIFKPSTVIAEGSDISDEFVIGPKDIHDLGRTGRQNNEERILGMNTDDYGDEHSDLMGASLLPPNMPHELTPTHAETSIEWDLNAAKKAVKEARLTTPVGDNAYEYYQSVLAAQPDNIEALNGLQKMVDLYIQYIEKAIADGQQKVAWVYLKRAESILHDSSKLQNIRSELVAMDNSPNKN